MTFNPAQWAREHERLDQLRFEDLGDRVKGILKVLTVAGTVLVGVLGWSLKTQYDGMRVAIDTAQVQLAAIHDLKAQVSKQAN